MDAHFGDLDRLYRIYRARHAQVERDLEDTRQRIPNIWPDGVPIPMMTSSEFGRRVRKLSGGDPEIAIWVSGLVKGVEEEFPLLAALLAKVFNRKGSAA